MKTTDERRQTQIKTKGWFKICVYSCLSVLKKNNETTDEHRLKQKDGLKSVCICVYLWLKKTMKPLMNTD